MKFAISGLVLSCSMLAHGANLLPNLASTYFSKIFGLAIQLPSEANLSFWDRCVGLRSPSQGAGPVPAPPVEPEPRKFVNIPALIQQAAKKHNIPEAFVKSIVAAESNFNCDAISPKGAIGLMQLMPDTAQAYGADPSIPEQNVDAGTHYLRVLMDKYGKHGRSLERVIAAYNAGPAKVDRYRGVPPFRETRRYVVRVLNFLRRFQKDGA